MHVYENHLGGYYTTEHRLTYEEEYCEQCGDSDWYLGQVANEKEAERLYNEHINHVYD